MYHIRFKRKAYNELLKLPSTIIKKVAAAIDELASTPCPKASKKLKGSNENI